MSDSADRATDSLVAHAQGDPRAAEDLLPLVYADLRALAAAYMADERLDHTLQPTALVHEAYLRLIRCDQVDWRGRAHFLAMAATTLRRVLVDHARARNAQKRSGGVRLESVDGRAGLGAGGSLEILDVDSALEKLGRMSPRQAQIVEMRFFGGLSVDETAAVLGVGKDRVKSDWRFARAWLKRELSEGDDTR